MILLKVAVYEQTSNNKNRMNHAIAVKQYARSSADQQTPLAHELRPVSVLKLTMGYLLHRIMDLCETPDVNLAEWYHFLWDRTRGIRKDITQQEICCEDSVTLIEQCARFHIHCSARLVAEDVSVFDQKINTENLTKCLQTLKYMYHDLGFKNFLCPNEPEFRGYIVLLNLHDGNFMWEMQQLKHEILTSPQIKFALAVFSAIDKNNYVRFFQLATSTTYLNACILLRYFNQVRFTALLTILKSYSPRQPYTQFPVNEFKNILAFEDIESTVAFLESYGLALNEDKSNVVLNRKLFRQPDTPLAIKRAVNIIDSKRYCSVGEIVCGAELPAKDFETHTPMNSFDGNGFLIASEIPNEYERSLTDSLTESACVEMQNEVEKIAEENNEKNNFKNLFTFSKPVTEVTTAFELPKIATNFVFQTPNWVQEVSEIDGNIKDNKFSNNKIFDDRSKSPLNIFGTKNDKNNTVWGMQYQTNSFDEKAQTNIFGTSVYTPTPNNIMFPISPVSKKNDLQSTNERQEDLINKQREIEEVNKQIEEERKRKLLEEKHEREAKFKKQEFERLEKQRLLQLEEERKRELRRKRELAEKQAKLKNDVSFILNKILLNVEETAKANRLKEIWNKIQNRKLIRCYEIWKNATKRANRKRKNFFDSSIWISSRSVSTEAKELHTESQEITLQDIKRYKLGVPQNLTIPPDPKITKIDIFTTVWKILFENLSRKQHFLSHMNIFWKVLISCPDSNETQYGFHRLEKFISSVFALNEKNECVTKIVANNGGFLAYCFKKINDFYRFDDLINGVLFIISNKVNNYTWSRLEKICSGEQNYPIAVIVKNCDIEIIDELKLYIRNKNILKYVVLQTKNEINFTNVLINALRFLANNNINNNYHFEMDSLKVCLRKSLSENFYTRLNSSANINYMLKHLLQDPNIVISLHNESVQHLLQILFYSQIHETLNFPEEFQEFLDSSNITLPNTYEYFPNFLKRKSFLVETRKILESFILPKFNKNWPPENQFLLQTDLEEYCSNIFNNYEKVFFKIIGIVFRQITNFEVDVNLVSWTSILEVIVSEKINDISFYNLKYLEPYLVFYKIEDLNQYLNFPWWYHSTIIKDKLKFVKEIKENVVENVVSDQEEDDMLDLDALWKKLDKRAEADFDSKKNEEMKLISNVVDDVEESLEVAKAIMAKYESKLKEQFDPNFES